MDKINDVTERFLTACSSGDLSSVIELYSNHYLRHKTFKSKVLSFLNLSNNSIGILDPHYDENLPFRYASSNGHEDIISYLLNQQFFIENIYKSDLALAIGVAISINDIATIKAIEPFIKHKNKEFLQHISKGFVEACREGYLDVVKYAIENLDDNDYFDYQDIEFPNIYEGSVNKTIKEAGFIEACNTEKIEVVKHILSDKAFSTKINNPILSQGLIIAIHQRNENLINLIVPNIQDKNVHYYWTIGKNFSNSCSVGDLDTIRYMLNNKNIDLDYMDLFQRPLGNKGRPIILDGFMNACKNGKLNVVKYLTASEELPMHIDVKAIASQEVAGIIMRNYDVMQYLVFELNLERNECFMLIPKEFESLFEKKKLKDELDHSIDNQVQSTYRKKLKI
jgi:hypothetical protein